MPALKGARRVGQPRPVTTDIRAPAAAPTIPGADTVASTPVRLPLNAFQLGEALVFADTATLLLLLESGRQAADGAAPGPEGQPPDLAGHPAEIDQATGMLTEQLSAGIYPAARLRLCQ